MYHMLHIHSRVEVAFDTIINNTSHFVFILLLCKMLFEALNPFKTKLKSAAVGCRFSIDLRFQFRSNFERRY